MLRKVLKTYKNLVFFPDSMKDVPMENWEILPIEDFVDKKNIPRKKIIKKENVGVDKKTDQRQEEIKILKELLKKYPKKSLERKAIESEVKKRE